MRVSCCPQVLVNEEVGHLVRTTTCMQATAAATTAHLMLVSCCPQVLVNEEVGHLVRTKTSSSNEGGVAAGFAVLDSPLLSEPGEGLLPPQLEGSSSSTAAAASWGASGGVLAAASAVLQSNQK
jgi:hypothetical protein